MEIDDKPTELTIEDIDKFEKKLLGGDFDMKSRSCWKCSKAFFPNYNAMECDECFFSQFPKEQVEQFYRTFF